MATGGMDPFTAEFSDLIDEERNRWLTDSIQTALDSSRAQDTPANPAAEALRGQTHPRTLPAWSAMAAASDSSETEDERPSRSRATPRSDTTVRDVFAQQPALAHALSDLKRRHQAHVAKREEAEGAVRRTKSTRSGEPRVDDDRMPPTDFNTQVKVHFSEGFVRQRNLTSRSAELNYSSRYSPLEAEVVALRRQVVYLSAELQRERERSERETSARIHCETMLAAMHLYRDRILAGLGDSGVYSSPRKSPSRPLHGGTVSPQSAEHTFAYSSTDMLPSEDRSMEHSRRSLASQTPVITAPSLSRHTARDGLTPSTHSDNDDRVYRSAGDGMDIRLHTLPRVLSPYSLEREAKRIAEDAIAQARASIAEFQAGGSFSDGQACSEGHADSGKR